MADLEVASAKGVYRKMDMIKAVNLKKYYTSDTYEVRALDGVSLTVEDGEFIAVVGTSGCGKTTLMNILGGLDTSDFGGVWIRNTSLKDLNKEERTIFRRRNIGFVFQQYNLIPSLSIRENIVLPMRLDGKEIDVDFFNEIVEILGLKDKSERFPSTLSGGFCYKYGSRRIIEILCRQIPSDDIDRDSSRGSSTDGRQSNTYVRWKNLYKRL